MLLQKNSLFCALTALSSYLCHLYQIVVDVFTCLHPLVNCVPHMITRLGILSGSFIHSTNIFEHLVRARHFSNMFSELISCRCSKYKKQFGMVQREQNLDQKNIGMREFPGGQVVKTQCFHCHSLRSVPGWGTKILQAAWCGQKATTTLRWNSYFATYNLLYVNFSGPWFS